MPDSTDVQDAIKRLASDPQLLQQIAQAQTNEEKRAIITAAGLPILTPEEVQAGISGILGQPPAGDAGAYASGAANAPDTAKPDVAAVAAVVAAAAAP